MENPKRTQSKLDNIAVVNPPLVIPEEISLVVPKDFPISKSELEINLPTMPEIVKPSEEGENWNEKLPKQGYNPEYPEMPSSSGTLL